MPFSLPLCAPPSCRPPSLLLPFVLPAAEKRLRCWRWPLSPVRQTQTDSRSRTERHTSMSSLLDFYGITSAASASGGGEDEPAGGASDEPRAKDDRKELASENFEAQVSNHSQQARTTGCSLHRCPLSNCVSPACASSCVYVCSTICRICCVRSRCVRCCSKTIRWSHHEGHSTAKCKHSSMKITVSSEKYRRPVTLQRSWHACSPAACSLLSRLFRQIHQRDGYDSQDGAQC